MPAPAPSPLPWPTVAVALGAAACQWLIGEIRFSSVRAEWVLRGLFLLPALVDLVLGLLRSRQAGPAWRRWAPALPAWLVLAALAAALAEKDAQGAIFVFMLPFLHALLALPLHLLTRPR